MTMLANARYLREKRQHTRLLTKRDPVMVTFTKDKGYAHINALGNHRYHRAEHRANRTPNPAPHGREQVQSRLKSQRYDGGGALCDYGGRRFKISNN